MSRFETLELTTSQCGSRFTLFVCIEFNWNEMVWVPYRCIRGSIWLETCHRSGNKIYYELFLMTCYHFRKKTTANPYFQRQIIDSLHRLGSYFIQDGKNSHWHLTASSRKTTLLKHLDHQPLQIPTRSCQEKKTSSAYGKWCKKSWFFNVSSGWLGFAGGWTSEHQPIVGDFTWAKFKNPPVTFHDTGWLIGILTNGYLSSPQ